MNYDLLVIGGEREGIDRAISMAQDGHRVAVIGTPDGKPSFNVICHAAKNIVERRCVSIDSWRAEVARLTRQQILADAAEFDSLDIQWISGDACFVSPDAVEVSNGGERRIVSGDQIVIACGTKSCWPCSLRGDERFVFTVESLMDLRDIPRSMIIVGAGRTGMSAAMMLATMGVEVSVVDEDVNALNTIDMSGLSSSPTPALPTSATAGWREDPETTEADPTRSFDMAFRIGNEAVGVELRTDLQVAVRLASGLAMIADAVLVCVGREGKTQGLNLDSAGVGLDERGRLWCNEAGQTWAPRISAVGDVIGFPRNNDKPTDEFRYPPMTSAFKSAIRPSLAVK